MGLSAGVILSLFMALKLKIVAMIGYYLVQAIFGLFLFCFYTVFYLDLAGIKSKQTENLTNSTQISQE
jgi:hypothetical protein